VIESFELQIVVVKAKRGISANGKVDISLAALDETAFASMEGKIIFTLHFVQRDSEVCALHIFKVTPSSSVSDRDYIYRFLVVRAIPGDGVCRHEHAKVLWIAGGTTHRVRQAPAAVT
jgi:hypothetical protein